MKQLTSVFFLRMIHPPVNYYTSNFDQADICVYVNMFLLSKMKKSTAKKQ